MAEKFYITTAISYPNASPHIGHAYEAIAADALARFKRLDGYEVFFLTGTDDHGQKIYRAAKAQGITPQEMTDALSKKFTSMCARFNISYDRFIRTSEPPHHQAVRAIWQKLEAKGDIYQDKYEGWYAVREEEFYTESELIKNEKGEWQTPGGAPVEWMKEDSYFFRLSSYQQKLLDYYQANPDFISPKTRYNEILSFVKGGLKDLSISRSSFDWGVQAPTENKLGEGKHIVYVWLDALTNYLTACDYPDENSKKFKLWPADLHLIGKDILRFHTVYWPAFLMSAELAIPKKVFAHGMILTEEGEKMSKSLKNVIDPFEQAELYGVDEFRYFLLSNTPFGNDGAYSEEMLITKLNADLANNLGNLAQRCLTMIQKNYEGRVPEVLVPKKIINEKHLDKIREAMDRQRLDLALRLIFDLVSEANRIFTEARPWEKGGNQEEEQRDNTLYSTLHFLRAAGTLLLPFMPAKMNQLLDLLAVPDDERLFSHLTTEIKSGTQLPKPIAIFPRYNRIKKET